jgi:hypothetical protein
MHRSSWIDLIGNILSARSIPHLTRELCFIFNFIQIKVVIYSIEESAGSSVVFSCLFSSWGKFLLKSIKNTFLTLIFSFIFILLAAQIERIIIEAVSINIIRINFFSSLVIFNLEISATSRRRILLA